VKRGLCSADSFINLALCCLGFLPGLLHAWYIISSYPETDYDSVPQADDGGERGNVTRDHANVTSGCWRTNRNKGYGTTDRMHALPPHSAVVKDQQAAALRENAGESSAGVGAAVPPSYDQAVRGDHKVQV